MGRKKFYVLIDFSILYIEEAGGVIMALIDITGQKFGRLTVLHRDETRPKGHGKKAYWICQCDCGNIKSIKGDHIRSGLVVSCGCYHKERASELRFKDLAGQQFGFLTALQATKKHNDGCYIWDCQCKCGNRKEVKSSCLIKGTVKSCGCIGKSAGEAIIEAILKEKNIEFQQQYTFDDCISNKNYPLYFDFAIFKNNKLHCLIEFQGQQHYQEIASFSETLADRVERDEIKRKYCKNNNIPLIEIPYTDLSKINIEYIKEKCKL